MKPKSLTQRLDALEGKEAPGGPHGVLRLPANGKDLPGRQGRHIQIFDLARCTALEAQGVDSNEAIARSVMTGDELRAYNAALAAGDPDDDVGDEPPRFDDTSVTAREDAQ